MKNCLLSAVMKFQKGIISKRVFLTHVNDLILKVPIYLGYKDKDIRHEFFALVISKIDKMISSYKKYDNAKFETWFNLVLKREFFNFIKKINKKNKMEKSYLNELSTERTEIPNDCLSDDIKQIDFSTLTEKEKNIVALKYGIQIGQRDITKTLDKIIDKMEKKKRIETLLTKKHFKIIALQREISNEVNSNIINEMINEIEKVKKSKRRMENILNKYSVLPSNKWVGEQVGILEGTVAAYLFKIKNKILKKVLNKTDTDILTYFI